MKQIKEALQGLENENIPYCILRNYQFLDGDKVGNDVDVAIPREYKERVTKLLSEYGFFSSAYQSKRNRAGYKGYAHGQIIKLDVSWNGSEYNGLPTVDIERLLANRRRLNGCWIPSEDDYFVEIIFHSAIKKKGFKKSYERELQRLTENVDKSAVRKHAKYLFGSLGLTAVDLGLCGNFNQIPELKWRLVIANCLQRPNMIPDFLYILLFQNNIRKFLLGIFRTFIPSPTPIVAITGPDGSGKSTLTRNAVYAFEKLGYDARLVKLGLTNDSAIVMKTVKPIYNRLANYDVQGVLQLEHQGKKSLSAKGGFHKAVVHYADILLRYSKARLSWGDIIIADRYVHDIGIYDNSAILTHTFSWFESDSTYLFILSAEPSKFAERSEYTEESLQRLVKRYESLNFDKLDATKPQDLVLKELLEKVLIENDLLRYL
jgi:thymidylate kinase